MAIMYVIKKKKAEQNYNNLSFALEHFCCYQDIACLERLIESVVDIEGLFLVSCGSGINYNRKFVWC